MTFLGLALAYATLFIAGIGVTLLLLSRAKLVNPFECACLAWLFGVGIVSLALWVGGSFVSGLVLQYLVTALCLLLGHFGWQRFNRAKARFHFPRPQHPIEWILAGVLLAQFASILYLSYNRTLGWDGMFVWEIKARYAFLDHGILSPNYFSAGDRTFSHPEYPLALPFTQLWLYLWMGEANQFWAKSIFPVFYIVGATLLGLLAARLTGRRWLGYVAAILLFFVPQVTISYKGAVTGYADFPVAVFYLATVGYLVCSLTASADYSFAVSATCLAFLPWLKREGVILWGIAALVVFVVMLVQRRDWRYQLRVLLPAPVLVCGWNLFLRSVQTSAPSDFIPINSANFHANLNRIWPIYHNILVELTTTNRWGIFWLLVAIAVPYAIWRWRNAVSLVLLSTTLLPLLLYSGTYIFSAWHHYLDHVTTSFPRLIMQVVPLAWLLIVTAMAPRHSSPEFAEAGATRAA